MRHLLFALLLVGLAFSVALAPPLPLTTKEVTLMLRSGYSSESVQQELAARRFAEPCDATTEKALRDAGASPVLIEAIKSGSYASSPADAQAAREQLAARAEKHAIENERLRKMDLLYQKQRA